MTHGLLEVCTICPLLIVAGRDRSSCTQQRYWIVQTTGRETQTWRESLDGETSQSSTQCVEADRASTSRLSERSSQADEVSVKLMLSNVDHQDLCLV